MKKHPPVEPSPRRPPPRGRRATPPGMPREPELPQPDEGEHLTLDDHAGLDGFK